MLADSLSRRSQVLGSEWTLCPQAFAELLRRWPATIDLFATSMTHRLPMYFSPMYDPMSVGSDAMLQSWDGLQAYAFLPFSLLRRVLAKAGFSDAVAGQLAHCRRRSTRVNYQAKWVVCRSWCHRHGHSVSRPTVAKVADFLLYLRRSLSLSYSSIASYRSMLSGVFRFILPELSSHFVLHDLLRSFRLEHPLPSSRVPPWDLLVVLHFLRGPPFEPLATASM